MKESQYATVRCRTSRDRLISGISPMKALIRHSLLQCHVHCGIPCDLPNRILIYCLLVGCVSCDIPFRLFSSLPPLLYSTYIPVMRLINLSVIRAFVNVLLPAPLSPTINTAMVDLAASLGLPSSKIVLHLYTSVATAPCCSSHYSRTAVWEISAVFVHISCRCNML